MHRKHFAALLGVISAMALTLVPASAVADHGKHSGHDLIRMNLTPSLPTDAAILGVKAGGLPWQIDRGEVRVRPNGRMDVRIEGLQVPRNGGADNPVGSIDAVLFCGGAKVADSGPHPMTIPGGDARFRVFLSVPRTCDRATVLIEPSALIDQAYIASAVTG